MLARIILQKIGTSPHIRSMPRPIEHNIKRQDLSWPLIANVSTIDVLRLLPKSDMRAPKCMSNTPCQNHPISRASDFCDLANNVAQSIRNERPTEYAAEFAVVLGHAHAMSMLATLCEPEKT
jgi:hypothetical protein